MPSSRIMVRRDLKQAQDRIDKIMDYLARSGSLYEKDHADIFKLFCALMTISMMLKEGLEGLRAQL